MAQRSVPIVDFRSSHYPTLDLDVLNKIIKQGGIEKLPTLVVAIGGVARSGKSFLLNVIVHFLRHIDQGGTPESWKRSKEPIQGINWAQSKTSVTHGIWMWNTPYKIKRQDGSEIAVLLVDCQGTGDNRLSDVKLDTQIMFISLKLANYQLINIEKYITSTELTSLQLCSDYADIDESAAAELQAKRNCYKRPTNETKGVLCSDYSPIAQPSDAPSQDDTLFENLLFLVRNYNLGNEYGEDTKMFEDILEEGANEMLEKSVYGIKRAFKTITTFTFPQPGEKIDKASVNKQRWTLNDISEDFREVVKSLCTKLFLSTESATDPQTGHALLLSLGQLKMRLESTDMPEIGNPADALQESVVYKGFATAIKTYSKEKTEVEKVVHSFENDATLKASFDVVIQNTLQVLQQHGHEKKYGTTDIWRKYQEYLLAKFEDDLQGILHQFAAQKEIEALKEQSRREKEAVEKALKENTERMEKLQSETMRISNQLAEGTRLATEREKTNREHVKRLTDEMKQSHGEQKKMYERQLEAQEKRTERERIERAKAQQAFQAALDDSNEKQATLQAERVKQEKESLARYEKLQTKMNELVKSMKPPPPPEERDPCVIL